MVGRGGGMSGGGVGSAVESGVFVVAGGGVTVVGVGVVADFVASKCGGHTGCLSFRSMVSVSLGILLGCRK